jgi:hypothetical protein
MLCRLLHTCIKELMYIHHILAAHGCYRYGIISCMVSIAAATAAAALRYIVIQYLGSATFSNKYVTCAVLLLLL